MFWNSSGDQFSDNWKSQFIISTSMANTELELCSGSTTVKWKTGLTLFEGLGFLNVAGKHFA